MTTVAPQHGEHVSPGGGGTRPVRLSVNLGAGPAEALRELMARKDITATEAIRRALSIWKFVEDERAQGHTLAILEGHGPQQKIREVVIAD